jgi:valyl-tRNA synthetase
VEQLKKLGCSCDWQRERFTMDEGCSKAVLKVFKKLYDDGLIYRGERIITGAPTAKRPSLTRRWSTRSRTAFSGI